MSSSIVRGELGLNSMKERLQGIVHGSKQLDSYRSERRDTIAERPSHMMAERDLAIAELVRWMLMWGRRKIWGR
jgi:hypothetical protein